ncbi:histidine kinase [Archangium violaceum]|uniref:sensor histidine kinase n=1 Tax=Archangium violaceum TaxID=83451 RepID=UPI00194DB9C2|nr:ATP-binding protein [Archangium violaceum]QRN93638.1 histidine kinase [Archangium violaceum]
MTADHATLQAQLRVKRRSCFVSAALILGIFLVHRFLLPGDLDSRLVLVQLAWSTSFVLLGLGVGVLPGWFPGLAAGLVCLASVTAIIHFTGGPASPYLALLVAVPLLLAMFTPDSRLPMLLTLGATVCAVAVLDVLAGVPTRVLVPRAVTFALVGMIGAFGSKTYRRLREAERVAQEERLAALEQLAKSERLRLHAERERAEVDRLVMVGQLAAGVAHEVNNPLAFVRANLSYLKEELRREDSPPDPAELGEVLTETEQGLLRIQQIVTDLRRFSREGSEHERVELGSPKEAMEEARRLASVRLRGLGEVVLDADPELPRVGLGQRHLVQVLLNLLLNAADAVESASPPRPARVVVRARRVAGGVRLEVEDNGPGIPPEVLPRLFEPFFTTKPPGKGTGLGLALCRGYVTQAGGTLHVENRTEGGARFVLLLQEATEVTVSAA